MSSSSFVSEESSSVISDGESPLNSDAFEGVDESTEWPKPGTMEYRDCVYLTETISHNPYAAPKGQSESAWKEVAGSVAGYGRGMDFKWNSIRDRVNKLVKQHSWICIQVCARICMNGLEFIFDA